MVTFGLFGIVLITICILVLAIPTKEKQPANSQPPAPAEA
jgi:hypothetical protein